MTNIQNNNENELEELLIKNLPTTMKAGNEKNIPIFMKRKQR